MPRPRFPRRPTERGVFWSTHATASHSGANRRPDEALVFRQRRDRGAIFVAQGNGERAEIGFLAFRPGRLGDRDDILLVQQPGDRYLRRGRTMFATDGGERGVVCCLALRERRVGGQRNLLSRPVASSASVKRQSLSKEDRRRAPRANVTGDAGQRRN